MAVSAKIKNLAPGAYFNAGPVEVVVLEHFTDGRTLLAAKEPIGNRPFTVRPFTYNRMEPEPAANNFAFSTLCHDLNTDFLGNLDDAGVIPANKVLEAEWSLADHDGTNRYGVAVCKVAMLPEPLVRKYYDAGLLEIDDWEWTITPYAGYASNVRYVFSGGSLDWDHAYRGYNGVRPAFFVDSEICLSLDQEEIELSDEATCERSPSPDRRRRGQRRRMIGSCELKARVEESLGTVLDPDFFGQAEQYARRKLDMCNERAGRIYGEDGYGDEYLVLLTADTVREMAFSAWCEIRNAEITAAGEKAVGA